MHILCPRCKSQNTFNPENITQSGERIICNNCRLPFFIRQKLSAAQSAKTMRKVMVANSNPHFCSAIKDFLSSRDIEVIIANDGIEAMQFLEIKAPHIALVDVALPGMYGFEICDFIKKSENLKKIKIILLASIHDKTRYKRRPTSIYGADDYIEMHHIPDQLIPKINNLLGKDAGADAQAMDFEAVAADEERLYEKIKNIADSDIKVEAAPKGGMEKAREEAMRLARIIISDILLYNQEAVESGLRDGNLLELIKDDIREGQAYFAKRVPPEVRKNASYLKNAFEELIAKMRKEMGV